MMFLFGLWYVICVLFVSNNTSCILANEAFFGWCSVYIMYVFLCFVSLISFFIILFVWNVLSLDVGLFMSMIKLLFDFEFVVFSSSVSFAMVNCRRSFFDIFVIVFFLVLFFMIVFVYVINDIFFNVEFMSVVVFFCVFSRSRAFNSSVFRIVRLLKNFGFCFM